MAVRIRMMRMGRKNRPYYRIGAFDAHEERDGKVIENLGRERMILWSRIMKSKLL